MKVEIKNAILEILSDDATVTKTLITDEDFTWVFDYVKANAEQIAKTCELVAIRATDAFLPVIDNSARALAESIGNVLLSHAFYTTVLLYLFANKAHTDKPPSVLRIYFTIQTCICQ